MKKAAFMIGGLIIGAIMGGVVSPQTIALGVAFVVGMIGLTGGWLATKKFLKEVDSDGVKDIKQAVDYPVIKERLAKGFTFTQPSA